MNKLGCLIGVFFTCGVCDAQTPNWLWAKGATGNNGDIGKSISVGINGNIYVTGWFESPTLIFGSDTLTNPNATLADIFIVKYDASGNVIWAKGAGGHSRDNSFSIASDINENIYITGWAWSDSITFDSITISGSGAFIAKYDSSGNALWVHCSSGNLYDYGNGITVDPNGNSIMTGTFSDTSITFGTLTLSSSSEGIYLVKWDPAGNVLWGKVATGMSYLTNSNAVAVDNIGNSYITGVFYGSTLVFDTITLTNTSSNYDEFFIAKYDSSGNVIWAKSAFGSSNDDGYCITTDINNNVYVSGSFESPTITFDNITLINAGGSCPPFNSCTDIFLAKYDSSGTVLWANSYGSIKDDVGYGIANDAAGDIYLTGSFKSQTINFGNYTLTNSGTSGGSDIFAVKYTSSGNVMWAVDAGGWGAEIGCSIATDAPGHSYITGYIGGQCNFGSIHLVSSGGVTDFYVAKLDDVTGIAQQSSLFNMPTIFPNPVNDILTITVNNNDLSEIILYDMSSRKLLKQKFTYSTSINTEQLAKGIYIYEVRNKNGVIKKGKIVKD
jgi:hypothetical protein